MGTPKPARGPFKMIGYIPSVGEMSIHLDICAAELKANLRIHGNFKGFQGTIYKGKLLTLQSP